MNCPCCGKRVVYRKRRHRWWVLCPTLQQGAGLPKVLVGPCYSRGQAETDYRMKLFRRAAEAAGLPL